MKTIEELEKINREIEETEYWVDFLGQLKTKDLHSYHKLLKRIEKSEELFANDEN